MLPSTHAQVGTSYLAGYVYENFSGQIQTSDKLKQKQVWYQSECLTTVKRPVSLLCCVGHFVSTCSLIEKLSSVMSFFPMMEQFFPDGCDPKSTRGH